MFELNTNGVAIRPIGANVGTTSIKNIGKTIVINQCSQYQQKPLKPGMITDGMSIKSFKENKNFLKEKVRSPSDQISFRNKSAKNHPKSSISYEQQNFSADLNKNKINFLKADTPSFKFGNENDPYSGNVVQTKPDGQMLRINNIEASKIIATPGLGEKDITN
jgi:hypothetical protein